VLNVEDMGVAGTDVGSGVSGRAGDEHWEEGGECDCEKTRCISSRASPMRACSARSDANVGVGVIGGRASTETCKALWWPDEEEKMQQFDKFAADPDVVVTPPCPTKS